MVDVGKCHLPELLRKSKMSQQDLADRLGVTRQQINAYCKNTNIMTLPIAKNISIILDCQVDDLYEWISVPFRTMRR